MGLKENKIEQISVGYSCGKHVRPTAMASLKYKNEPQKIVHFRGNDFCIFFFVCAPLWAGQVNGKKYTKMRRRSVEYWPSKSLAP